MIYIDLIKFPSNDSISKYSLQQEYPYNIFLYNQFEWMNCKDITILYGNNGSGKSTILNLISQSIGAQRKNDIYKNIYYDDNAIPHNPFDDFAKSIKFRMSVDEYDHDVELPTIRKLITSDDIFKKINDRVKYNRKVEHEIEEAREKRIELKYGSQDFRFRGMEDYEQLKSILEARKLSGRKYAAKHSSGKEQMMSNGETALEEFKQLFETGGIYLLDEPENCLSPVFQIELMKIIQDSVRYFDCQFIICTHSPLILSMKNAVIYNLDREPVISEKWNELENVKLYYDFFKSHKDEFE